MGKLEVFEGEESRLDKSAPMTASLTRTSEARMLPVDYTVCMSQAFQVAKFAFSYFGNSHENHICGHLNSCMTDGTTDRKVVIQPIIWGK